MTSQELAFAVAAAADDAKATDIAVYDLRGTSSLTDFAIVCTATSVPHLRAVLRDVEKDIWEKHEVDAVYADRAANGLWTVLDYIDVMLHVMGEEVRDFYALEQFWKPENKIEWQRQA